LKKRLNKGVGNSRLLFRLVFFRLSRHALSSGAAEFNLLFGMAVQNDFVSRDALIEGIGAKPSSAATRMRLGNFDAYLLQDSIEIEL
jgi:hypothetical protein